MKTAILTLAAFVGMQVTAQTVLQTTPAGSASPGSPGPAYTPAIPPGTNNFGTPALSAELAQLLLRTQARIEQTLPLLAAFNDSFASAALQEGGSLPVPVMVSAGAPSSGVSLAGNFGTCMAVNFGQTLAPPTGFTVTNIPAPPPALIAPAGTNGLAVFPLNPETLRGLLQLQNDMERLLPVLNAVNRRNYLRQ